MTDKTDTPTGEAAAKARLTQALRQQATLANSWTPARDAEYQRAVADVAEAESALARYRSDNQEMTR
jgi:hypothetical protein